MCKNRSRWTGWGYSFSTTLAQLSDVGHLSQPERPLNGTLKARTGSEMTAESHLNIFPRSRMAVAARLLIGPRKREGPCPEKDNGV